MGDLSGSREPNPQAVSALSGFDPGRDDTASILMTALDELRGCMIRRPGNTCEVRKEYLEVALVALDLAIAIETRRAETGNTDSVAER